MIVDSTVIDDIGQNNYQSMDVNVERVDYTETNIVYRV